MFLQSLFTSHAKCTEKRRLQLISTSQISNRTVDLVQFRTGDTIFLPFCIHHRAANVVTLAVHKIDRLSPGCRHFSSAFRGWERHFVCRVVSPVGGQFLRNDGTKGLFAKRILPSVVSSREGEGGMRSAGGRRSIPASVSREPARGAAPGVAQCCSGPRITCGSLVMAIYYL